MTKLPADPVTGVKSFSIGGRMVEQRQRCLGMTDEERRWRAQWLKDQVLTPEEPRNVPEFYKHTTNIFRRTYKTPLYMLYKTLEASFGHNVAFLTRQFVGKMSIAIMGIYIGAYYLKYHSNDFAASRTLDLVLRRPPMYPDDPDYPNFYVKEPHEYYDQGFYSSVLCQKVEPPPPPPPEPPVIIPDDSPCAAKDQTKE